MSNLGAYQWIITAAKKVGGPINFLLLTGAAGAALYKGSEIIVKQCVKTIKANKTTSTAMEVNGKLYEVTSFGKSNEDLELAVGERFRVLEADGDSVLIEKIGNGNNPYFVSSE